MRPRTSSKRWNFAVFGLFTAIAMAPKAQAAPQQILVEVVKPPVLVYDSPDQKKGTPLKPGKQTVAAGKWLKAGKTAKGFGVVRAYTLRGVKESKAAGWLALTPLAASEATPYAAMLAEIMRPAGRLKGAPTPIAFWSPGQFGKIWADNFRFRWAPTTAKTLHFQISKGGEGPMVWELTDVDAASGVLDDVKAVQALKDASGGGAAALFLSVKVDNEPFQQPLLIESSNSQPELAAELEWWSKNATGAAAHLGRAGAFQKRGFLSDSAHCYLDAWKATPNYALARDGFRSSLARLGMDDAQIAAVMKQVSPNRKP